MSSARWFAPLALFVWLGAWLQGPAFRAAVDETSPSLSRGSSVLAAASLPPRGAEINAAGDGATDVPVEEAPGVLPLEPLPEPSPSNTPSLVETTNVLILGVDKKPGQKWMGRPDTLVLAVFSARLNKLGLVSIPRDLYVEIDGHGPDRINAAFSVAQRTKVDPSQLTRRVLEDTLALPVHHTLSLDLGAFEALVDALGGVTVRVPCPIYDNFVDERTESGRRILDVEAGLVPMDGITAGLYARSRHGRSDWNRARRQQAILFGMKDKILSVDGLFRLSEVVATLEQHVKSDMTRAQMLSLGAQVARLSSTDIHGLVLGAGETIPTRLPDGKQVLVPDAAAIDLALRGLFSAEAPGAQPEHARCFAKQAAVVGR